MTLTNSAVTPGRVTADAIEQATTAQAVAGKIGDMTLQQQEQLRESLGLSDNDILRIGGDGRAP